MDVATVLACLVTARIVLIIEFVASVNDSSDIDCISLR
jgi:hypothetical protein